MEDIHDGVPSEVHGTLGLFEESEECQKHAKASCW